MLLPLFDFVNSALCGPCCCKLYTCVLNCCEQSVFAAPAIVLCIVYCVLWVTRAPGNRIAELGGAEGRQRVRQRKGEFLSYFQDKSTHGHPHDCKCSSSSPPPPPSSWPPSSVSSSAETFCYNMLQSWPHHPVFFLNRQEFDCPTIHITTNGCLLLFPSFSSFCFSVFLFFLFCHILSFQGRCNSAPEVNSTWVHLGQLFGDFFLISYILFVKLIVDSFQLSP